MPLRSLKGLKFYNFKHHLTVQDVEVGRVSNEGELVETRRVTLPENVGHEPGEESRGVPSVRRDGSVGPPVRGAQHWFLWCCLLQARLASRVSQSLLVMMTMPMTTMSDDDNDGGESLWCVTNTLEGTMFWSMQINQVQLTPRRTLLENFRSWWKAFCSLQS